MLATSGRECYMHLTTFGGIQCTTKRGEMLENSGGECYLHLTTFGWSRLKWSGVVERERRKMFYEYKMSGGECHEFDSSPVALSGVANF